MFIGVLFMIPKKLQKHPKCRSTLEHPYSGILHNDKKEQTIDARNNLDGS